EPGRFFCKPGRPWRRKRQEHRNGSGSYQTRLFVSTGGNRGNGEARSCRRNRPGMRCIPRLTPELELSPGKVSHPLFPLFTPVQLNWRFKVHGFSLLPRFFQVAAESEPHRRKQFVLKTCFPTRREPLVEG